MMNLTDKVLKKYLGNTGFSENKPIKERIPKYNPEKLYKAEAAILVYNNYIKNELKLSRAYSEVGMIDKVKVKDTGKKVWEWIKKMLQKLWTIIKETFKKYFKIDSILIKMKNKLIRIREQLSNKSPLSEVKHPINKYENKKNKIVEDSSTMYTFDRFNIDLINIGININPNYDRNHVNANHIMERIISNFNGIAELHQAIYKAENDIDLYGTISDSNRKGGVILKGSSRNEMIKSIINGLNNYNDVSYYSLDSHWLDYLDYCNTFISKEVNINKYNKLDYADLSNKLSVANELITSTLNNITLNKHKTLVKVNTNKNDLLKDIDNYLMIVYFMGIIDCVTKATIVKMKANIKTIEAIIDKYLITSGSSNTETLAREYILSLNTFINNYDKLIPRVVLKVVKRIDDSLKTIKPII